MGTIGPSTIAVATSSIVLLLSFIPHANQLELGLCGSALGMENGEIKDNAITASSAYDSGSVGPQHGRLRNDKNGGAWCPRQMVSRDAKEYLEINLDEMHVMTGGRTQGRFGNGQGQEYAEEYMIDYWRPGFTKWVRWKNRMGKELLPGNTNTFTIVDQKLDPPVIASKIRFLPYSDHVRTVCMRVELIGCKWADGLLGYDVPQGTKRGPELDLTDRTYDGQEENGRLTAGLGQLVDGATGQDNFRADLGYGKGYEWVGWRNDTPGWAGHPLEILFTFDKVRNFSAVHLHTNNLFNKDVQVFSHARAFFSIYENAFNSEPVHFSYMPDLVLEHARNVTIKLHNRIGRFVKLQLYFAARWILLSEVSFDSVVVTGNFTVTEEDVTVSDSGREYPFQRDEVKRTLNKMNRNVTDSTTKTASNQESKHYIGFVIAILTVVILILVAAILFIVVRNHRTKTSAGLSPISRPDERNENKIIDNKFNESYQQNFYRHPSLTLPNSPDYTEVPDLVCPGYGKSPAVLSFLPKPPPVPPPPDCYYTRDICRIVPLIPTPPLSPPLGTYQSKTDQHFMLPLSPEPDDPNQDDMDEEIEPFPHEHLRIIEKIGEGLYGDVHLCEVISGSNDYDDLKVVVVHTLRIDGYRPDFLKEVKALARLRDPNISRLIGASLEGEPIFAVREYAPMGDLCQYLQDHVAETATPLAPNASTLSYGCLIYMATQVASGMKYLETLRYVHKDLAARNCLVGRRYEIKVSDLGSYRQMYSSDYCQIGGSRPLPLRWMAWESVLLGKFSSKSDVWSFAVLLWEILTFAREQPFEEYGDEKVIENATHLYQDNGKHIILDAPINCPKEIFDLMCECWQRNESDRPNFHEIHLFLQRKNLGYNPDLH